MAFLKLVRSLNRKEKTTGTPHFGYRLRIPPSLIEDDLGWKHGQELQVKAVSGRLIIERANPILAAKARRADKEERAAKKGRRSA